MTSEEILKHIDDGAIFYLDFFGDAEHMESTDNGIYRMIKPKENEQGIKFVLDLRLNGLTDEEAQNKIAEIKSLSMPVWWPIYSKRIHELLYGKDYVVLPPTEGDEFYMALLPGNPTDNIESNTAIKRVETTENFKFWADIANQVFAGGYGDIHSVNHFHWCEKGKLIPYITYYDGKPVAIAAILNNNSIASLEFVATLGEYRRKRLARAVCIAAICDAFANGAKIITTRAFYSASLLYQSLGFQIYY